ncbi:aldose epimerase family protein [Aquimarina litoralis]|uniref:aldose epimerase family protein n=1 Tax=Aquimarina litoralis TaxID=584605 RepID=UPI001C596D85|nr:aldose epimerase family protein [Aquimarina litoralis]MBW1298908.1 galactose-1-epimerase [Aquimarina litoralis]
MIENTLYMSDDLDCIAVSLCNSNGAKLTVTNYGASVVSLEIPNKKGTLINVIVGLEDIEEYEEVSYHPSSKFLGASIGRYAGRISKGSIQLGTKEHKLYHENGVHLHGGLKGFDKKFWKLETAHNDTIVFSYESKHLEEGYPGNLSIRAIYQLSDDNELIITYQATTDHDTFVNLTNHSYFNLNGSGSILNHRLILDCPDYLEVDTDQLPTGQIKPVTGTKYDFLKPESLKGLESNGVIDDTFIFGSTNKGIDNLEPKITISSPESGLKMEVQTNQPAVVIYTPENFPDWNFKNQVVYDRFPAICFECQNYPDAPNQNHFPSSFLKTGEHYENKTVFKFLAL